MKKFEVFNGATQFAMLVCTLLLLSVVSNAAHAASGTKDKEFPYTRQAIIKAYDDVMQQVIKMRPLEAAKEQQGSAQYHDSYSYMLTPNVGVMFQCDKGGKNPTQVKAIGVEDGTQETRAFIVLNAMSTMAAVTPGWQGAERGAVAKELGITTTFPTQGAAKSLSYGGRDFHFANNGEYGVTLTISPTASNANATPQSAPKK